MDNFNDPIIQELAKAYVQLSELYHGNVSDCMNQCKEVHPHLSTEQCKEQYCQDSMTTQGDVNESHTHEELVKLSDDELAALVDEYTKKAAETEGEEKEHHEKELADIKSIVASRKDDKEEVKEEAEQIDETGKAERFGQTVDAILRGKPTPSDKLKEFGNRHFNKWWSNRKNREEFGRAVNTPAAKKEIEDVKSQYQVEQAEQIDEISNKTKISYYLKSKQNVDRLRGDLDRVQDDIEDKASEVTRVPGSGMNFDTAIDNMENIPGGEELGKQRAALRAKIAQRKQGQARVEKTTSIKPASVAHYNFREETRSAKEIVQNISEWMKIMKGKKNGKSK